MGARPQGRLVPISTPPWPPHGPGRGPRKQSGNRSPKKSAKVRFCGPLESKTEVLGGNFDAFFVSGGKVRTELSPARELRLASLERSRARPFSCSCSSEVKCWIPVWLFRIFIDLGGPVGIPKRGQNPFKIDVPKNMRVFTDFCSIFAACCKSQHQKNVRPRSVLLTFHTIQFITFCMQFWSKQPTKNP